MGRPSKPMFAAPSAEELCEHGALSIDGVAEFSSLSKREIEKAVATGEIEIFHRGNRVLIAKREAVRWLAGLLDADRAKRGMLKH